MSDNSKKLVTWKNWVLMVPAVAIGASLSLYREYRDTGHLRLSSIVISAATFCGALVMITVIFWYANRPEKEDKS